MSRTPFRYGPGYQENFIKGIREQAEANKKWHSWIERIMKIQFAIYVGLLIFSVSATVGALAFVFYWWLSRVLDVI